MPEYSLSLLPDRDSSLALLQAALDLRATAMCLFDASDRLVCWNTTYTRYFPEEADMLAPGVPYEATLRRFYETNLPPDELPLLEHHVAAGLHRHHTQCEPYVYQRRDGHWLKAEIIRGPDGSSLKLWTDVTTENRVGSQWPDLKDSFAGNDSAFALYAADGRCVSANKRYLQLVPGLGDDPSQLQGDYAQHIRYLAGQVVEAGEQEQLLALLERANFNIERVEVLTLKRRDGRWLELEQRPTQSGGLIAFWRDVTDQIEAQERAVTLQQRLSDAIENLAEGVALFDRDDRLVMCNSRFRDLNQPIADLIRPGAFWADLLRAGSQRGQFLNVDPTEAENWVIQQRLQRQRAGRVLDVSFASGQWLRCTDRRTREGGTISVRSDITDLKQREAELARQAAMMSAISYAATRLISKADFATAVEELLGRLGTAAQVSRVMVSQIVSDEEGEQYWTPRFEWCANGVESFMDTPVYQQGKLSAADPDWQKWVQQQQVGGLIRIETAQLNGTLRQHYEHRGVVAALSAPILVGSHWWGSVALDDCQNAREWSEVESEVLKTTATLLAAILQRNGVESELVRQREALHQAEKLSALGTLLAGVAHELNNPLAIVAGQAQLMAQQSADAGTLKRANKIHEAADRCARIVKTFLAMARQRPVAPTEVNLNELLEAAVELTAYALRSHDIQLTLELATGLPPLWLDRDQLSQVVLNLIVNAQHALLDVRGQRQLLISTSHDATTGTVQLQVTDNGPGVPRALRQRIFEPFYTTKPVGVGTGIGLSICRNIVAFYGGSITVQDGAGGGACFQVTLPLAPAPPAATHSDVDGQASSSTGQPLLIVDDEVEIAELLAEMLSRSGYRCSLASSGMQALQQLAAGLPELIISDLRMPDMDGPSLYQAVCRRYPQLAERFIFVTGDSLGSQTGLERIQNVPVIEKPFDMQEIGQTVSRLLAMPKPSG